MKILVLGSKGMLGSDFMDTLTNKNFTVIGADIEDIDITVSDETINKIQKINPDIIINCVAYTNVDLAEQEIDNAFKVNATGSKNVAIAAKKTNAKLVYFSTDYVFDGTNENSYFEWDKTNPINIYGKSKLYGEELIREQYSNHFILRISWLYGKHGNNFVHTMLKLSNEKNELNVVNDQTGSPTWTMDVVNQTIKLMNTEEYGTYHSSAEGHCTWFDFTNAIFEIKNINTKVYPTTTKEFPRPAQRPKYSILENKMLKLSNLNIMRDWKESLKDYLATID